MKLSCTGSLTGPTALPRLAPDPTIPTRGNHLAPTVRSVLERPGAPHAADRNEAKDGDKCLFLYWLYLILDVPYNRIIQRPSETLPNPPVDPGGCHPKWVRIMHLKAETPAGESRPSSPPR